jgi:hypothetical protein
MNTASAPDGEKARGASYQAMASAIAQTAGLRVRADQAQLPPPSGTRTIPLTSLAILPHKGRR